MKAADGFTLLEAIIAMTLLLFIIFSLGILIPQAQIWMQNTSNSDVGVTLAENVIEKIRSMSWSDIVIGEEYDGYKDSFDRPLREGAINQYPPLPYPRIQYQNLYPVAETKSIAAHNVEYAFVVKATYEKDGSGADIENLIRINVDVYWIEPRSRGVAPEKRVTIVSKVTKK